MLPSLRKCKNLTEFMEHLKGEKHNKAEFLVWRSIENVRELGKAVIKNLRVVNGRTRIEVALDQEIPVEVGEQLYFYQEMSATLFKAVIEACETEALELRISGWPFLAEKRADPRFEFVDVQYFLEVSTYKENLETIKNHQVVMRNISINGFAFTLTAGRAQRFQVGDKIVLRKVEKIAMPSPVLGTIAHVTPLSKAVSQSEVAEFSKLVLVGVRFDESNSIINEVLNTL